MQENLILMLVIGFLIGTLSMSSLLIIKELPRVVKVSPARKNLTEIKVLIWGAGAQGVILYHQLVNCRSHKVHIIGYIDDSQEKHKKYLNGVKVLGSSEELDKIIKNEKFKLIIQAFHVPKGDNDEVKNIENRIKNVKSICESNNIHFLNVNEHYKEIEKAFDQVYQKVLANQMST